MLTVKKLYKKFEHQPAVNNVSFTLEKGVCTALIGPNGAGKTTILRMLSGLIKQTSGTITYHQNDIDFRYLIGYLPQYPSFYNWMTGEEFLTYCSKLYGLTYREVQERTAKLFSLVDLTIAKDKRISTYSGGMKQRLGLAQALIYQPKILFLDEPVSSLDPIGRRDVLSLMEHLKEKTTILFSTHILNDADEVSDSLIVLKDGVIVEQGTMKQLQTKYSTSKIIVQFTQNPPKLIDDLNDLQTVTSIDLVHQKLHIYVTEVHQAQTELFQFILDNNLEVTEFYIDRVSMEEMFLKAVN